MILNKDVRPDRKIYYIGSLIIEKLMEEPEQSIDYLSIYEGLRKEENITSEIFFLTLDWLFLLGAIKLEEGVVSKCF
ncbi:MAG: ABC-three component system middle component 6 [Candidatus Thiodiazotropha endolucinida]